MDTGGEITVGGSPTVGDVGCWRSCYLAFGVSLAFGGYLAFGGSCACT